MQFVCKVYKFIHSASEKIFSAITIMFDLCIDTVHSVCIPIASNKFLCFLFFIEMYFEIKINRRILQQNKKFFNLQSSLKIYLLIIF